MTEVTRGIGSEQTGHSSDGTGHRSARGRCLGLQRKVEFNFRKSRKLKLFFIQLHKIYILQVFPAHPSRSCLKLFSTTSLYSKSKIFSWPLGS